MAVSIEIGGVRFVGVRVVRESCNFGLDTGASDFWKLRFLQKPEHANSLRMSKQ